MTWRDLLIGIGVGALALAALVVALAVRAVMRRTRAGKRRVWAGLVFRGLLIAVLIALGVASLVHLPAPALVNRPAPTAADALVVFAPSSRTGVTRTVVAVSGRDGATRWTQTLPNTIVELFYPAPGVVIAAVISHGLYAFRASDGSPLWRFATTSDYIPSALITADASRVYALLPASPSTGERAMDVVAFNLMTGKQAWRAPLAAGIVYPRRLEVDGGLLIAGGDARQPSNSQWGVVAFDAATGAQRWFTQGGSGGGGGGDYITALLGVRDNVMVIRQSSPVTALRARDGAVAWSEAPDLAPNNPPRIFAATTDADTLYLAAQPSIWAKDAHGNLTPPPVSLLALDAASGMLRWRVAAPPTNSAWTALEVSGGVLMDGVSVTSSTAWAAYEPPGSALSAYDAATGRALWSAGSASTSDVAMTISSFSSPLAVDGVAYLAGISSDPYVQDACIAFCPGVAWLYAINIRTGAPWWRVRVGYVSLSHIVF